MLNQRFLFDSGATISVARDSSIMHNVTETNTLVHLAGGKTIISKAKGKIRFNDHELDCVYLPEGENNIISINQLHALNYGVFSTTGHIVLLKLHTIPKELVKDFIALYPDFLRTLSEFFRRRSGKSPKKVRIRCGEGLN